MKLSWAGVLIPAILGGGICGSAAGQDPPTSNNSSTSKEAARRPEGSGDPFVLQYGETVLPLDKAAADAPRQRRAEDPWVEIVSIVRGNKKLVVELNVIQGKPEWFTVVLKSASGRTVSDVRRGMMKMSGMMLRTVPKPDEGGSQLVELPDVGDRVEAWVEYEPGQIARPQGFGLPPRAGIKISLSKTLGKVGQLTYSRTWTDEEKEAAEKLRLETAPPPPAPDGHVVIKESTKPLIAGMPILIVDAGRWTTSELLGVSTNPGKLIVRKSVKSQPTSVVLDRGRCAVSSQVLERAESDPAQFKPSLRVFPGSGSVLTKDFELITPETNLAQGMALLSSEYGECMFAGVTADGKLNVRGQFLGGKLYAIDRSRGAVKPSEASRVSNPDFAAVLAGRYRSFVRLLDRQADLQEEMEDVRKKLQPSTSPRNSPRSSEPPNGTTALSVSELVPTRLPVLVHDGGRWHVAVVVEDSPEGRVDIRREWPYAGEISRVSRKGLFVRLLTGTGDLDPRRMLDDQSRRKYTFVLEAEMLPYEVRQMLTKDLGVDPMDRAMKREPCMMELTADKTSLEARMIEYQLLASGVRVTVSETREDAAAVK